jgi:MoaE-MoaD fusion protein
MGYSTMPVTAARHARVTNKPLSLDVLAQRVRDSRAGATVTFQGTAQEVEGLELEAYVAMAESKIVEIVEEAAARYELCAAAAEARVGEIPRAEPCVVVAVSAPHRAEAFAGAREIIDRIRAEAPIWRKEAEGGERRWARGRRS